MNCPVCLSASTSPAFTGTDFLFETTTRVFHLDECAVCRCLFLNPQPPDDEIATFYPEQYWWSASRPGSLKRLESVYRNAALLGHVRFIASAAPNFNRDSHAVELLDVGCGSGSLLRLLRRKGYRVLGVDFSAEASRIAANENGVKVFVGSLADAKFQDERFDIVSLFHVMEHVTRPSEVLHEVFRILKPSGSVILQVPNVESWQFQWFGARWYGLDVPRHVIDYSLKSIVRLLNEAGFQVRRVRHFNLRDNAPALASSVFPSLDPVSRSIRQRRRKIGESFAASWSRHLAYLALVCCAYPIAILEAACGRGATVMIEAGKGRDKVND